VLASTAPALAGLRLGPPSRRLTLGALAALGFKGSYFKLRFVRLFDDDRIIRPDVALVKLTGSLSAPRERHVMGT
jgi:hypothetical protein